MRIGNIILAAILAAVLCGCTAVTVQCSGRDTLDGGLGSSTTGEAATAEIVETVVEGATD